jgi:uncharacterized protein
MINFDGAGWAFAILAGVLVGIAKTSGVAGLGMLSVAIFAQLLPAKQATGIVLPMLFFGDIVAVATYRRHAKWTHVWRLFPWTAAGVVLGYLALDLVTERQARVLIGVIVLSLSVAQVIRRRMSGHETEHGAWFAPTIGVLAGFTTLVANAAGPLMAVYFLAMRLPKMDFVGTGAVFFLILNFFKIPFMVNLGLINAGSFRVNLLLLPAVLTGNWIGWKLLARINQRTFENIALALSVIAGLRLLW